MSDEPAVLFANDAFYAAFAGRDMAAMAAVWATDAPVACNHPGWNPIAGRDAVLDSFRRILEGGSAPEISCRGARAHLLADAAFVTCYEAVGEEILVATNIFVRRPGGWKMVHHHAGAAVAPPAESRVAPPVRLQ